MEVHPSIVDCLPVLEWLRIGGRNLKRLTHVPESVTHLDLSYSVIESIPECVIGLSRLESLFVYRCRKILSLLGLPLSLKYINANDCGSLERVSFYFSGSMRELEFQNCLKLDEESRRVIMLQRVYDNVCLPGKEVPAEFTHKATGNSLVIPMVLDGKVNFSISSRLRFKACLLLSPIKDSHLDIACLITKGGVTIAELKWDQMNVSNFVTEHLFICGGSLVQETPNVDVTANEILFEFSCRDSLEIIECGVQIMSEETESSIGSKAGCVEIESGGSSYHHTYGDENYEPEAVQVSHRENVHSSKYKCNWNWRWLKKLCSGKEDNDGEDYNHGQQYIERQPIFLQQSMSPIMIRRR